MYKIEEKIFFDGMRQAQNAAAYFSLCTLHSAELALIDAPASNIAPLMTGFKGHGLEFIHGLNQSAGYRITQSELNLVHAISLDNAGHFILDDRADTAAFSASHRGLLESTYNHSVDVLFSGTRVLSINALASFAIGNNANISFAANHADSVFKLALDYAANNIAITVNGMMSKKALVKLDAENAVRRFYVDAEISITRINVNLINGHAGTGNDGRIAADNFVFNNAIAGKKSADGVRFLTTETQRHGEILFYHEGHEVNEDKTAVDECLRGTQAFADYSFSFFNSFVRFVFFVVKTSLSSVFRFIVSILTPDSCLLTPVSVPRCFAPVLTPVSCLLTPVFINNKNNIVEAITLRCA